MENEDPNVIRTNNIIEGYKNLKKDLEKAGLEDEAKDLVSYTLANNMEEADATYPTLINNENGEKIGFVLLKHCPIDDARAIVSRARSKKMEELLIRLQNMKPGDEKYLEGMLEDFNGSQDF